MQTLSTWHQRPCTRTRKVPWIWVVRWFCRSHLQQMFLAKLLEEASSFRWWKHHEHHPSPCHQKIMRSLIVAREPYRRFSWCWSCARSLLHGSHIEFRSVTSRRGIDALNQYCRRDIGALHQHCLLHTEPQHCLNDLQPPSGCVVAMHPLLQTRTSCHMVSWRVLRSALSKNGFYSDHAMLIVILHTLRQPFPCQLLLSKCWGPCDIRRKPPPTDTFPEKKLRLTRSDLFVHKYYVQLLFHDEVRFSCISPTSPQTHPLAWMLDEVKKFVKSVLRNEIDPMLPTQLSGYFRDLLTPPW
jgi:hypothetical protein